MSTWPAIERIARQIGVSDEALRKWRLRGVPRYLRLDLLDADRAGEIDRVDFDQPPRAALAERELAS
jgi:hypothetical protein